MKSYTFMVLIEEGNDEFWEELAAKKKTGCDEITAALTDMLDSMGFDYTLMLAKFEDKED